MENNTLQTRLELQASLQQWINSMMSQYSIPASMMEDALTKALIPLKDQILQEYLTLQAQAYQKALEQSAQAEKEVG